MLNALNALNGFVAGAVALSAIAAADPGPANPSEPTLAQVRAAVQKYADVRQALADGYIQDPSGMCETAAMMGKPASLGAMGIHYFRPDLLGITAPPNPRIDGNGTSAAHTVTVTMDADASPDCQNATFNLAFDASAHSVD